jgi:hypothetical protein
VSEVAFPDDRVMVIYEVTVAGTSGSPKKVALVGMPGPTDGSARPHKFVPENALPKMRLAPSRAAKSGGTMSGEYEVRRGQRDTLTASKLQLESNSEIGISVATSRFPQGELYGALRRIE